MRLPVDHKMKLARFPLTINQYPDYHHVYSYVTISKNLFVPRSNTGHTTVNNNARFRQLRIGMLEKEFPASVLNIKNDEVKNEKAKTRDRVFTVNNTLLTMVLTSV